MLVCNLVHNVDTALNVSESFQNQRTVSWAKSLVVGSIEKEAIDVTSVA